MRALKAELLRSLLCRADSGVQDAACGEPDTCENPWAARTRSTRGAVFHGCHTDADGDKLTFHGITALTDFDATDFLF